MPLITINGIAIDPDAPKLELAAAGLDSVDAKKSDYLIVQTTGPLAKSERASLDKAGATILEAVPGDAYICKFPKTSLTDIRALKFVKWADVYPQGVKISPALKNLEPVRGGVALLSAEMAGPGELDATAETVDVVLHRGINPK